MPRESTITVFRSTSTDVPTGLTFGEIAYSDLNGKLFVGKNDGTSLWIGAGVTDTSLSNNSSYLVPTQSAVKTYVDGIVGGGSVVNSINGTGGNITVTGDGGSLTTLVSGTTTRFSNRLASTSVTGVASFNSSYFTVASGAVSLASGYQVTGDTVQGDSGAITTSGTGTKTVSARLATTSVTGVASFNSTYFTVSNGAVSLASGYQVTGDTVRGDSGAIQTLSNGNSDTITARIASTSLTGVAYYDSTDFAVAVDGLVTINKASSNPLYFLDSVGGISSPKYGGTLTVTGGVGIQTFNGNTSFFRITGVTASTSTLGVASFNSSYFTVASGAVSLASGYQVTGDTVQGDNGSQVVVVGSGNTRTVTNRLATTSVTGVASFNSSYFTVASGAVSLASGYQVTGDTVQGDSGAITTSGTGTKTVSARLATTSLTGVASFNSTYFGVAAGAVSLASAYQVTGDTVAAGTGISVTRSGNTATVTNEGVISVNGQDGTVVFSGDGGAISLGASQTTIGARVATSSLTGVASFNSTHFTVSAAGAVTSNGITVKASSGDAGTTLNLGGTLTITGTANQVAVTRSGTDFTLGLPNDITIPGNLTVNGTVVTANVDSFVVEDPLIMLGTGNAADSVDLGFYGQYTSSGRRFAGLYRDASDSGKFKLFTNLTGGAEPTSFVNDGGSGYTVGTLVAKIDGGTF